MRGVDKDDLEVLVDTVLCAISSLGKAKSEEGQAGTNLVDPVGVEDAESTAATSDTLLGRRAEGTLELEVVDTLVRGLSEGGTWERRGRVSCRPATPPSQLEGNAPLWTGFLRLPRRTRIR